MPFPRASHPLSIALVLFFTVFGLVQAQTFRFAWQTGDRYRILSEVEQDVWVNGYFSHHGSILNKISVEIAEVKDGQALHHATYTTSEETRSSGGVYEHANAYEVRFWRQADGTMKVPPRTWVPTVRNVPVFPDRELKSGDTWTALGSEVHDLRKGLGLQEPFEFPIRVNYEFKGIEQRDGESWALINAEYTVFQRFPRGNLSIRHPQQVSGYSSQRLYWSMERQRVEYYDEDFMIVLTLSDQSTQTFQGMARARILDSPKLDGEKLQKELENKIDELKLENVDIRNDEDGVTISLEDIQFEPNSDRLVPGESQKLQSIAAILKQLPGYDLLVSGHTALAGTPEARQQLSEERARVVGQFLLDAGVRTRDQLMFKGFGATRPVAENDSPEGMRRNRRVEITILKN